MEFIETQQPHVVVLLQSEYIVDQLKQDQQQQMVIVLLQLFMYQPQTQDSQYL
ncbi:MAG: hypothetical protein ACKVJK_17250 [Methylophagaceae bacterium]